VQDHPIAELLEFFHAYTGYCVDPASLLSPLSNFFQMFVDRKQTNYFDFRPKEKCK